MGRKCFRVRFIPSLEWCSGRREGGGVELEPCLACRPQFTSAAIFLTDVAGNQAVLSCLGTSPQLGGLWEAREALTLHAKVEGGTQNTQ